MTAVEERRKNWIEALRSGEYRAIRGNLNITLDVNEEKENDHLDTGRTEGTSQTVGCGSEIGRVPENRRSYEGKGGKERRG